jgi:hypothetical protein
VKKYLAVYQATTQRRNGVQVSTGNIDVSGSVLDMATIRDWERKIRDVVGADQVVITNLIPLER